MAKTPTIQTPTVFIIDEVQELPKDLLGTVWPPIPVWPPVPAPPTAIVTKRNMKRTQRVVAVREHRDEGTQRIGYLARPFILCALPFKKPPPGTAYYRRQNGDEVLEITASPEHGLPFGMDLEVLIWVTTLAAKARQENGGKIPRVLEFSSGAEFLNAFGLPLDGDAYKRAQQRFLRVFYATWFFGKKNQHRTRMFRAHFFDEMDLWFSKDLHTGQFPGDEFRNRIVLSEMLHADMERHLPPIDLAAIAAWSDKPSVVYFYLWLNWRCYTARGRVDIPLTGPSSLREQCGFEGYAGPRGPRRFRQKIAELLDHVRTAWPACPATVITDDPERGDILRIERRALAILPPRPVENPSS